jgi:hypothetical protein
MSTIPIYSLVRLRREVEGVPAGTVGTVIDFLGPNPILELPWDDPSGPDLVYPKDEDLEVLQPAATGTATT